MFEDIVGLLGQDIDQHRSTVIIKSRARHASTNLQTQAIRKAWLRSQRLEQTPTASNQTDGRIVQCSLGHWTLGMMLVDQQSPKTKNKAWNSKIRPETKNKAWKFRKKLGKKRKKQKNNKNKTWFSEIRPETKNKAWKFKKKTGKKMKKKLKKMKIRPEIWK